MQKIIVFIIIGCLSPFFGMASMYPEVIFDNSLVNGSYAKSVVSYQGESWVENVSKRLLVSDQVFFTPGNALSLKYLSSNQGDWSVRINYSGQKKYYRYKDNDNLSFYLYVKSKGTKQQDLPRLYIRLDKGNTDTLSLDKYITKFAVDKWIQVKIPCKNFKNRDKDNTIKGIGLVQGKASSGVQHIYLDQIEFVPSKFVDVKLNSPAILTDAIAYDRLVQLKWQLPLSPSIRYVKLYRSIDGKDFSPVGIRPIYMQSCLDVVPQPGIKYYYKIVWLDNNYEESPSSFTKEAAPKSLNDSAIVELVKATHINYFVENFDINSGMYIPFRSKDKAIVSTKETGGAILSLIVGVENKQISRNVLLQRISKITYFLLKAQNNHGIFPAYFDGRKGVPEYLGGQASYDVRATATLIEALLIAREYFDGDNEAEKDLRSRITSLYDQIDWLALADENMLIKPSFSVAKGNEKAIDVLPLYGVNDAMNTYLLAVSSRKFALPTSSYFNAVYNKYGLESFPVYEELDVYADSLAYKGPLFVHTESQPLAHTNLYIDSVVVKPIWCKEKKYGLELPLGEYNGSLMDLYKPFKTIRPSIISDSIANWDEILKAYVHYVKRRDNEYGVGATSSDIWGFYKHKDTTSNYRINPAIGPSAVMVDNEIGLSALLSLYKQYGTTLLGEYGFRSWLDLRNNDESDEYFGINQSTLVVMLENAKSGLIWQLYERIPELRTGREKLFSKSTLIAD